MIVVSREQKLRVESNLSRIESFVNSVKDEEYVTERKKKYVKNNGQKQLTKIYFTFVTYFFSYPLFTKNSICDFDSRLLRSTLTLDSR